MRCRRNGGNIGMGTETKLIDVILGSDTDSLEAIFYKGTHINFTYSFTDNRRQQLLNIIAEKVEGNQLIECLIKEGVINNFKNEIVVQTCNGFQSLEEMAKNDKNEIITCCVGNYELPIKYEDVKKRIFPNDECEKMKIISQSIDQNVFDRYKKLDWITDDMRERIDCRITQVVFNKEDSTKITQVFKDDYPKYYVRFSDDYVRFPYVPVVPDMQSPLIQEWCDIQYNRVSNKHIVIDKNIEIGENTIKEGIYGVYGILDVHLAKFNTIGFYKKQDEGGESSWNVISDMHTTQYLACCLWIMWCNESASKKVESNSIRYNARQRKYGFKNDKFCAYFMEPEDMSGIEKASIKLSDGISVTISSEGICLERGKPEARIRNYNSNCSCPDAIQNGLHGSHFDDYCIDTEYTEKMLQEDLVDEFSTNNCLFPLIESVCEYKISISVNEKMIQYITDNKDRWLAKIINLAIKKGYIYIENDAYHYVGGISKPNRFYKNVLKAVIKEGTSISLDKFNDTYNSINRLLHLWGNEEQKDGIVNIEEYSFEDLKGCYQRMEEGEVSELLKYALGRLMFAWLTNNETSKTKLEDAKQMHWTVREFMQKKAVLKEELMKEYVALIKNLPEEEMYTDRVLLMRSCFEEGDFEEGSEEQKRYLQCFEITEKEN